MVAPITNEFILKSEGLTAEQLINWLKGNNDHGEAVFEGYNFIGAHQAASKFSDLDFDGGLTMGPGILLSSGTADPALKNNQYSYSVNHGKPGDAEFDKFASEAFGGAGKTYDAAILEFQYKPDATKFEAGDIKSLQFDVMFGSEEYPGFIDSSFVDIGAISINGVNYGYFDGEDRQMPISVVSKNVSSGLIQDNMNGQFGIEYNGISQALLVSIDLTGIEPNEDGFYDIRIGIADTGDGIYDSGLFVSNFRVSDQAVSGTFQSKQAEENEVLLGNPVAPNHLVAAENSVVVGGTAPDVYVLPEVQPAVVSGTLKTLDGDVIYGFGNQSAVFFGGVDLSEGSVETVEGSTIMTINLDDDTITLTFAGDFHEVSAFTIQAKQGGTFITLGSGDLADFESLIEGAMDKIDFANLDNRVPDNTGNQEAAKEQQLDNAIEAIKQQLAGQDGSGLASQQLTNFFNIHNDPAQLAGLHPLAKNQVGEFADYLIAL